jgi:hypothetical protein
LARAAPLQRYSRDSSIKLAAVAVVVALRLPQRQQRVPAAQDLTAAAVVVADLRCQRAPQVLVARAALATWSSLRHFK